jgi:hypothetical protein
MRWMRWMGTDLIDWLDVLAGWLTGWLALVSRDLSSHVLRIVVVFQVPGRSLGVPAAAPTRLHAFIAGLLACWAVRGGYYGRPAARDK